MGGTWNLIAGQPTDDSEMALVLARKLVWRRRFDQAGVADAYVKWRQSEPFDIGNTTAKGIEALAAVRHPSSDSQSNGALMRVSPIGIFASGDRLLLKVRGEMTTFVVPAHTTVVGAVINNGDTQTVYGSTVDTTIELGGTQLVYGADRDAAVYGTQFVYGTATDIGSTVLQDGVQYVYGREIDGLVG